MAFDLSKVLRAAGQLEGLSQHNQMLMTIELPDHLVIAYARAIEIRDEAEIAPAGGDAGSIIAPPVDIGTSFERGIKERKTMPQDFVRERFDRRRVHSARRRQERHRRWRVCKLGHGRYKPAEIGDL